MNEIVEPLGLRQVELAVLQSAAGELAGIGGPQARDRRQRLQQRRHDGPPAMDMEFREVLAGRAFRTGTPQNNRIIDRSLISIG